MGLERTGRGIRSTLFHFPLRAWRARHGWTLRTARLQFGDHRPKVRRAGSGGLCIGVRTLLAGLRGELRASTKAPSFLPRLVPVPRDVPEPLPPPTGRAAARIFLRDATTVTAGRLPAAPSTAAGLSLRSAATGPDTGRDARHRGGLSDAKAGGGDAATRLSAVVLA